MRFARWTNERQGPSRKLAINLRYDTDSVDSRSLETFNWPDG